MTGIARRDTDVPMEGGTVAQPTADLLNAPVHRPPGHTAPTGAADGATLDGAEPETCPYWCAEQGGRLHGPFHRLVLGEVRLTGLRQGDRTTISYGVRRRVFRTDQERMQLHADLAVVSALVRRNRRSVLPLSLVAAGR